MSKKKDPHSSVTALPKRLAPQYKVPRDEFFSTKKGIYFEVDRKEYIELKMLSFQHKISIGKLFERLTQAIIRKEALTRKIIDEMIDDRFHKELARLEASALHPNPPKIDYSSIDSDKLYELISKRLDTKNNANKETDDEEGKK